MFLCREKELRTLNNRYTADRFECIVVYGRRRVGKTSLLKEFCKDKKVIYYSALDSSAKDNLRILSRAINTFKEPDSVSAAVFQSYDEALEEITNLSLQEKIIFVIDEYPYLAKADKSISSRIQHLIDHQWQNGNMFLILCGSSMSFMERQVLGYESPLYGRRTAQMKIKPLTYLETAKFNPNLSNEENAIVYGITGGIPHYINKLRPSEGIKKALLENVFDSSAYLFEEPENLLKQELREPAMYNAVITSIANGASKLSEISAQVGIETSVCTKYLQNLIELDLIGKETPVTDNANKKTIYFIKDNFFRFWYRFVPLAYTAIHTGKIDTMIDKIVMSKLHEYMGLVFEEMCKDYLIYYADKTPIDIMKIGRWWGNDTQERKQIEIDIVGVPVPDEHEYIIGSCKFRNSIVEKNELELIKHYSKVFGKGKRYHYYIFSLSGFSKALTELQNSKEVTLLTLDDLMFRKH